MEMVSGGAGPGAPYVLVCLDQGIATSGTTTTLTDTTKSWATNAMIGCGIFITAGTGAGGISRITLNTATVLTFTALATAPDKTSRYAIMPLQANVTSPAITAAGGGAWGTNAGLNVISLPYFYDRNTGNSDAMLEATQTLTATGSSALNVGSAAGSTKKYRLFDITVGSNNAGVVVIADGATICNLQVPAGGSAYHRFGPNGILQPTANGQITATLASATLTVTISTDAGA